MSDFIMILSLFFLNVQLILHFLVGKNSEFWRDMIVITKDELQTLKKLSTDEVSVGIFIINFNIVTIEIVLLLDGIA